VTNNFQYYAPTNVVFGRDTQYQVGALVKETGAKKVLIHYGGKSAEASGLLEQVKRSLDDCEIAYVTLGGVVPNPHIGKVYEGIAICKEENVDFILAVGGGSVIDSAKAIAYGIANEGDVWELYEHTAQATACAPVGVVLTIAAAGSETSCGSVITNEKTGQKRAYDNNLARPKFAVLNPELTMTLPDYQTQSGCVDMLMHTMERYFTNGGNMEITDSIAEGVMRTIIKYAKILHSDPANYDARAEIMWAGSVAHNDLTGCGSIGDWSCHQLEHELGGMFNVTHGAGLAAVWGSWARYVYKNCIHRFVQFAVNVMGVDRTDDETTVLKGIEAVEDFYRSISMPTNLRALGIEPTDEQIKDMARSCLEACGGNQGSAKVI
jgi:alcohol dehydrogenase YqhD (iron-dependent ADH family)